MQIIIAGGSGLIGRGLTESLIQRGHQVVILSRHPESVNLPAGAQAVRWDPPSIADWAAQLDDADAVVNLAGASIKGDGFLPSRWTAKRKQLIRQSRVDVGQALTAAIRHVKKKPKVFIQASAVGYYGPCGDEVISESSPAGSDFLASVCQDWEASTTEVEQFGVRRAVIRTGLLLALAGGAFPLLALPFRIFAGNWFGSGRQYYPWIHYEDHISALRFLIEHEQTQGVFNLSAPTPVTNREFARTLGRVMQGPVWMPVPRVALQLALGEVSTVVMDGQQAVPERLQTAGFIFTYPDLEPALNNLLGNKKPR